MTERLHFLQNRPTNVMGSAIVRTTKSGRLGMEEIERLQFLQNQPTNVMGAAIVWTNRSADLDEENYFDDGNM